MMVLGSLFGIALAIAAAAFTGHWVLRPMARETRQLNLPTRFTMSDFVWLLLLLQIVLAALAPLGPPDPENAAPLAGLLLFFGGSATALWAFGISSLSRAGVTQSLRRGVFTVFLLPALLLFLMATGMGCFAVFPAIAVAFQNDMRLDIAVVLFWMAVGFLAWALISWLLRKVAEWVLGGSRAVVPQQSSAMDLPPSPFA